MVQRPYPKRCRNPNSSVETVANIEDLLTEILLRVPVKSLIRFKCVSKHWLSLISNPIFCHRHTLENPKSSVSAVFGDISTNFSFIPFPPDHDPCGIYRANHKNKSVRWINMKPVKVIADQYGSINIIHSCNGIFLCRPILETSSRSPYFVLNPTTNKFLTLAIPPAAAIRDGQQVKTHILSCSLAFDPSKSPHYKVICLETITESADCKGNQIQIYSSETRSWKLLNSSFLMRGQICYSDSVYHNGAIHWVDKLSDKMSYYHIDEERVGFVDSTPHCCQKNWMDREYRHFKESGDGHLYLIEIYKPCDTKFEVLEMGRDYSGWFVKYNVDLDPLWTAFPNLPVRKLYVLFLDRKENEDSSSLLLHTAGQVISYNLKSNTFKGYRLTTRYSFLVGADSYLYKETLAYV